MKVLVCLKLIIFSSFLLTCSNSKQIPPKAVKGVLDLRDWDFEKDGNVNLDGEWEFFWKEFPVGENLELPEGVKDYISVPGVWNGHIVRHTSETGEVTEEEIPGKGYATYKLKVLLDKGVPLGIRLPELGSSYSMYVNNILLYKSGTIAVTEERSVPYRNVKYLSMKLEGQSIDIVIAISNYQNTSGGMWNSFKIGRHESILKMRDGNVSLELFIAGVLFIKGIYHLSLFYLRREDKSPLYFGIFCLLIFLRTLLTGERYLHILMSDLSFSLSIALEYLTLYLGVPVFFEFLYSLYPNEVNLLIRKIIIFFSLTFSSLVIILPSYYFTKTLIAMQIILLFVTINGIYSLIKGMFAKRIGAGTFLVGFMFFAITIINDILHSRNIINTGYYVSSGLVAFIFAQSYLLSARFSMAFTDAKEARRIAEEQRQLVQSAKEEIERLGRTKDEFLANLSHEIKTPLVTIYGYSELITQEEDLPESTKEYGAEIYKSAGMLNSYMDDVLLVTDLETNLQLDKKPYSLKELVEISLQPLEPLLREKEIQLSIPDLSGSTIICDSVLFSRAIGNILKNAIVYNKTGGTVTLEVKQKGTIQEISIQDTGIGIESEYYEKIFDKFFRIDSSLSYEVSGVGLGLFLAKRILELHGGSISVRSEVGKSSEFLVVLPVN
jgi:two-component system, sensor histidine kinase ChiS